MRRTILVALAVCVAAPASADPNAVPPPPQADNSYAQFGPRQATPSPPCLKNDDDCLFKSFFNSWKQLDRPQSANPFDQFDPPPKELGPGPHVLIISPGETVTRMNYRSGKECQAARDAVRMQLAPVRTADGGVLYTGVLAFCVPQ